jgi:CheY-like chemotaxis protein
MIKLLFLVDDDADDREFFEEAIHHCNPSIKVIFAKDGIEAIEYLDSAETFPDAIFLDYNMPRMNGVECLKKIKANSKTRSIPIIMYTTSGDREQEKTVLLLGADHYMRKTTSFSTLCSELDRLLLLIAKKLKVIKK